MSFSVETDALRAFAATHKTVAAQISGAGNMDTATHVAAMTPVFGLIGADYLAMFAAAQVLHCQDINDLSSKVDKIGQSAFGTAASFDSSDSSFSSALKSAADQIGA
ncbi:type VII secretion target [Nocardia macrotermitis]|uniref:ESX-1 secretion-associated protein n=1 Tax=Nocardia macrotermitis TaxID=2585198 RepID=A0A7K0D879_9NOCA|nr:type VII secretion target [Nocardia macrotermitis]MQY21927.1 hypothetical protein [Nocardia macrotermitis]